MHDSRRYYLLGSSLLAVAGCYPQTTSAPEAAPARIVEVVELRAEPVLETMTLIGEVEPSREATLYFEVAGVVSEVLVEEGSLVEAGAPIASLLPDDYELALSQSRAELNAAQAELDLLRAGSRQEDIDAAVADHERARVRAAYWDSEVKRNQGLFAKESVSEAELMQMRRERDAAIQEERAIKARLARVIAGPREEEIEAASAEVEAKTKRVELAKRQLSKATLKAPFRGRVEHRLLDEGAYVNVFPTGGVPVVHLVDLSQADAVIGVPENALSCLSEDISPEIASAINPDLRAEGRVVAIGKLADLASGTYPLRVRIANPDGLFTGGMVVTTAIVNQQPRQAIRIPVTALRRGFGQPPHVLLVDRTNHRVFSRTVALGPLDTDYVEISSGLEEDALLIIRGQDRVLPGDRVDHQLSTVVTGAPTTGP